MNLSEKSTKELKRRAGRRQAGIPKSDVTNPEEQCVASIAPLDL